MTKTTLAAAIVATLSLTGIAAADAIPSRDAVKQAVATDGTGGLGSRAGKYQGSRGGSR